MAAVAVVDSVDASLNHFWVTGHINVSGSYPGTPGDTLSFAGIAGLPIEAASAPEWVEIMEIPPAGTSASGLWYIFAKGTTMANGQMQAFVSGAAGAVSGQLGNVTYASVNAANIKFQAYFKKFL